MAKRSPRGLTPLHPIQVVARRTGLSADVIRAWEKRYTVVTPARSGAGRRLYSNADIERLQLLAQATLTGRTIGQVASLPMSTLTAIVVSDGAEPRVRAVVSAPAPIDQLRAALSAVEQFDGLALDAVLRRASVALSAEAFLDALVVPLLHGIAERVRARALRATHRHLAFAVLRRALDRVTELATSSVAAPDLVVSTPSGQSQELGALLVSAAASVEGWRVIYVGPGLPAEDIAETATRIGARAVALSLADAPGDRVVPRELRRLRKLLPRNVSIVVEGAAADAHRGVIREIRATLVRDLPALRATLRSLRAG